MMRKLVAAGASALVLVAVLQLLQLSTDEGLNGAEQLRVELLSQPQAGAGISRDLVKQVYAEDEQKGQKIIQAMDGKVSNPLWAKLLEDPKMRGVLAAALGSAKQQLLAGDSTAFDLGNLMSGFNSDSGAEGQGAEGLRGPGAHRTQQMAEMRYEEGQGVRENAVEGQGVERYGYQGVDCSSAECSDPNGVGIHGRRKVHEKPIAPPLPAAVPRPAMTQPLTPEKAPAPRPYSGSHSVDCNKVHCMDHQGQRVRNRLPAHEQVANAISDALNHKDPDYSIDSTPTVNKAAADDDFVYNAFAPGVLPGTEDPNSLSFRHKYHSRGASGKTAVQQQDQTPFSTGFDDSYRTPPVSEKAKLRHEVQTLKAKNKQQAQNMQKSLEAEKAKREHLIKSQEEAAAKAKAAKAKAKAESEAEKKAKAEALAKVPKFDGKFEDFVGGKQALGQASATDKKVFDLLKVAKAASSQQVPFGTSHKADARQKQQTDNLLDDIERHAAFISQPARDRSLHPHNTLQAVSKDSSALDTQKDTQGGDEERAHGEEHAAGAIDGAKQAKTTKMRVQYVEPNSDWHSLAKKSKELAREAVRQVAKHPHLAPKVQKSTKWVTKVREEPLPYLCGMPLLAEASGIDCKVVKHIKKVPGDNHIADDLKDVGLGDSVEPGSSAVKRVPISLDKPYTPAQAIKALGYSSAHQYERHQLLRTIAKEEDKIKRLRAREDRRNGGLDPKHFRNGQWVFIPNQRRGSGDRFAGFREQRGAKGKLGSFALRRALQDDVGHLGDNEVTIGEERGDYDLGLARERAVDQ